MFKVTSAATSRKLTTLEVVKDELGISGNSEDTKLGRMIDRVSSMVCQYIGVPSAADGSVTLGLETIEETFRASPWLRGDRRLVILARRPVTEIVSIGIGAATIAPGDYELDGAAGLLARTGDVSVPGFTVLPGTRTVVTYKAGWTLPGTADYTLPPDIEGAAIGLIRAARFSATRDPAVKSEWTTDIERIDYWVGQIGQNGAFPPDIAATLDPYKYEPM